MKLLIKGVFGEMQTYLYTIAYKKRGLHDANILRWVNPADNIHPNDIDMVARSEIPDKKADSGLPYA